MTSDEQLNRIIFKPAMSTATIIDSYAFSRIPDATMQALAKYINDGAEPVGFLQCVLAGDLYSTIEVASKDELMGLAALCRYITMHLPAGAWGSQAKISAYIKALKEGTGDIDRKAEPKRLPAHKG